MATPKKLPSGNWRVQVYSHTDGGKKKYKSFTASTKAEAARMAAEYQSNRELRVSDITIGSCVDQYIKAKTGTLSPTTIRGYLSHRENIRLIENLRLSCLTSNDLQSFVSALSETLSPKSVKNIYTLLMSSISVYDERRFRVTLPHAIPHDYATPTDAEVNLLLDYANDEMRLCIILAAVGTLRRGEICALEYSDILYDFNAIWVHRDMIRDIKEGWLIKEIPKTSDSIRRVHYPKEVIDMIGHGTGRIYRETPDYLTKQFVKLRDSLGLKCRFHDLRHYAASTMHAIGVPDQYIMERGGWSSDRVLKAVYRNTLTDKSDSFTAKTNEYFTKNITRNITRKKKKA